MDSTVLFLKEDILHEEKSEADKVQRKAHWFWLSEDQSCIRDLFLDCIYYAYTLKQLNEELHEGIYGSHTGGRSLSHKAPT